jgi:hypothetical protein
MTGHLSQAAGYLIIATVLAPPPAAGSMLYTRRPTAHQITDGIYGDLAMGGNNASRWLKSR